MISIIIPCYNESGNIKNLISQVKSQIAELCKDYEIIIVDDGSTDNTREILNSYKSDKNVNFISLSRNFGHQAALKAGLDNANGDAVITMDADLQHPPVLIPELLKKWEEGYEIVNTSRLDTEDAGIFKKLSSATFYWVFRQLSGMELNPSSADFRLLDKKVLSEIKKFNEYHLFLRGLVSWIGFKKTYIEYTAPSRRSGKPKYSLKKMLKLALDGIISFTTRPLRIAGITGLFISLVTAAYILYSLIIVLFTNNAVPGWASILMSVLFIGGIQMLFIGLLGEYIGRIFIEGKKRPQYIIKDKSL